MRVTAVVLVALWPVLAASSCTKEQSCRTDPFTGRLVCTEKTEAPTWLENSVPFLIGFGALAAIAWGIDTSTKNKAKTEKPRPVIVMAPDVRPGDRLQGATGDVLVVKSVAWVSTDRLEVTFTGGATQQVASTFSFTRLPPPLTS